MSRRLIHQCCRQSLAASLPSSATAGSSSTSVVAPIRAPSSSKHKTPPGTNAKPAPAGRPKRDRTTYGIPPLNPRLLASGNERLSRAAEEQKQNPNFDAIWQAEGEVAAAGENESKRNAALQKVQRLREAAPARHPLWAFFHEKSQADVEAYRKDVLSKGKGKAVDAESPSSGEFSLAFPIDIPDNLAGRSGRSWHADELRRKSFDDLHRLWYILLIERNALHTQRDEGKRCGVDVDSYTYVQEQLFRIRKSMARIKYVLNERRIAAKEAQALLEVAKDSENIPGVIPSFAENTPAVNIQPHAQL